MTDNLAPQNIVRTLDSISPAAFKSDADRYAAKESARRLLARLDTPFERGWALAFEAPVLIAGLQMGSDLGIWEKWAEVEERDEGRPVNIEAILGWCGAGVEEALLRE